MAERGRPPGPSTASRAAKPVGTTRPSSCAATPGRPGAKGFAGAGRGGGSTRGSGRRSASAASGSAGSSSGRGAMASAPSTIGGASPQRRGAAAPHRAWREARAWETSDARVIGRPILERMFDSSRARRPFGVSSDSQSDAHLRSPDRLDSSPTTGGPVRDGRRPRPIRRRRPPGRSGRQPAQAGPPIAPAAGARRAGRSRTGRRGRARTNWPA